MYSIVKTVDFDKWLRNLKDHRAKAKVLFRIQRIQEQGNFGDCQPVGHGISELRIHYAKGYRVYFKQKDDVIVLLLCGGTKSTQDKDIIRAKELWTKFKSI